MPAQLNPLPTKLTVTRADSSTDVVTLPPGVSYDQEVNNWAKGGGYWDGATGTIFTPWPQIKSIVAS